MLGLAALTATSFFGNPTISIGGGRKATLIGTGPPVIFSTGLFGTMPSFFYSDLFKLIKHNVTLVTLDSGVLNKENVKNVASALGVSEVGFMSHSSFDASVLSSPFIRSAVLCDPIALPSIVGVPFASSEPFASASVDASYPVLTIRAERAYNAMQIDTPIPEFLEPKPKDEDNWRTETLPGVGHADVLDDAWADVGANLIPWINGPTLPTTDFRSWSLASSKPAALKKIRDAYRKKLATLASEHFLHETEGLPREDAQKR